MGACNGAARNFIGSESKVIMTKKKTPPRKANGQFRKRKSK
jgi:hypothetical protein